MVVEVEDVAAVGLDDAEKVGESAKDPVLGLPDVFQRAITSSDVVEVIGAAACEVEEVEDLCTKEGELCDCVGEGVMYPALLWRDAVEVVEVCASPCG